MGTYSQWVSSPFTTNTEVASSQGANVGFRTSHPRPTAHSHSAIITTVGDLNPVLRTSWNQGHLRRKAQRTEGWGWDTGMSDGQEPASPSHQQCDDSWGQRAPIIMGCSVTWRGHAGHQDPHPVPPVCWGVIWGWVSRHPHRAGCELGSDS